MYIRTRVHDGVIVRAAHHLGEYMLPLAVSLKATIGISPGQDRSAIFVADLMKVVAEQEQRDAGYVGPFPRDSSRMAREQRVLRLLASPVEVDGVVMSLVHFEKRHMYQKTKQIVLARGRLQGPEEPLAGVDATTGFRSFSAAATPPATHTPIAAARHQASAVVADPDDEPPPDALAALSEKFDDLKNYCRILARRVAALENGVVLGDVPPPRRVAPGVRPIDLEDVELPDTAT